MLLTLVRMTELVAKLEAARQESTAPGRGYYCVKPRTDGSDGDKQFVPKPRSVKPLGYVYPDGSVLVSHNGTRGIWVSHGCHGRAFLGIEPATEEVRCTACEKGATRGA